MTDEELLKAFDEMWGNFPEGVVITQVSREIIAANKKAREYGLKPGLRCSSSAPRSPTRDAG